jgi:hypothetical protein
MAINLSNQLINQSIQLTALAVVRHIMLLRFVSFLWLLLFLFAQVSICPRGTSQEKGTGSERRYSQRDGFILFSLFLVFVLVVFGVSVVSDVNGGGAEIVLVLNLKKSINVVIIRPLGLTSHVQP